jgi:hypothetical protein
VCNTKTHRIPDLQFDLAVIDRDHTSTEFHTDSKVMDGLEPLVSELEQQARLANACDNMSSSL